ncbi:ATP-binding protein [Streptomyces sp. NPDC006296]|uniref:sensor histidine kinase n=1 Tax=Streptomyces sp. NPDC006296 TaxID=3156746 RepID=UPI0033A7CF7D
MELATPPPAARAPVAWYGWWLMPLALGAGTVATAVAGPDQVQIPATFAGAAVTVAGAACVRLLVRTRTQLGRSKDDFASAQTEHSQQRYADVRSREQRFATERSALEAQLAEQTAALEARLAEHHQAYESDLAERARTYESDLAERAQAYESELASQSAAMERKLAVQQAAVARLGDSDLPEAIKRLRDGEAIDDILDETEHHAEAGPALRAAQRRILRTALLGVEEELNRSTSAEQAVVGIGSRIHVLTGRLRGRLHEMQGEHGRLPVVAQGLMELDQEIGPADCLAASIGVLGGSDRPGRQWQEPQRLLSVVRGGIGRIKDFNRIQVRHLPELGVDGGLVDHLTLIFAHLLDNAARYSPPTEPVVVSGKEVPNGVGIEIQDAGKGLSDERKREAEQSIAGTAKGPGLGGISEDANLGLRVVGALARRYGIRVTFADSPWLGTSVVVVVPHKYFSHLSAPVAEPVRPAAGRPEPAAPLARRAAPAVAQAPAPAASAVPVESTEDVEAVDTTPGGLPRRRSRRPDAPSARPAGADRTAESVAAVPPDASFAGLAAFATAGRESVPPGATTAQTGPDARETTAGRETNRTEESD